MKGVNIAMDKNDSTHKYIEHLNGIINYEVEKPYKEMDADLVEACVELSLELQGKNFTLSNEELEEKVRKIPFVDVAEITAIQQNKRKKIKKKRILLIAALIAILCAILAVFATGTEWNFFDIAREKFGSIFNSPIGESIVIGDDEYVHKGQDNIYKNIKSFCEAENYDVLLPGKLPDEIELNDIEVIKIDNTIIVSFNSDISSYEIYLGKSIPQTILDVANETIDINTHTCYVCRFDDVNSVQVYFEHNGNYYSIGGTNEQILLDIIENLEEYK